MSFPLHQVLKERPLAVHHRAALGVLRRLRGRARWALLTSEEAWVGWGYCRLAVARGTERVHYLARAWRRWQRGSGRVPMFFALAFHPWTRVPWAPSFPAAWMVLPQGAVNFSRQAGSSRLESDCPSGTPDREEALPAALPPVLGWEEGMTRAAWEEALDRALQAIARGELRKVVLARYRRAWFAAAVEPDEVLARLCARFPKTTCFLFEPRPGVAFVGATPELLVSLRQGRVTSMALAGSAPRGRTPEEDRQRARSLLRSSKDLREHAWVVRALVQELRPWVAGLEVPPQPQLRVLPNVFHLETPVRARLARGTWWDLIQALHPTPALGGWPREAALAFLRREEPFDRGWYGGVVGMVSGAGEAQAWVAIRSALLRHHQAWLFAGAGIVAGSHPAQEWEEIGLKFRPMMHALGIET